MENQTNSPQQGAAYNTKTIAGIALLGLGLLLLLKGIGFLFAVSWPVFMIVYGLHRGIKTNFSKPFAVILIAAGLAFLIPNIIPSLSYAVLWPLPMICAGLFLVFRRNQRWNGSKWEKVN
jgi:hypothetical protein